VNDADLNLWLLRNHGKAMRLVPLKAPTLPAHAWRATCFDVFAWSARTR
jgi:hypothetical protein